VIKRAENEMNVTQPDVEAAFDVHCEMKVLFKMPGTCLAAFRA